MKDIVGETAFHIAAKHGDVESLQRLIQNCTSSLVPCLINAVNEDGNTPLHLAAIHNQIKNATVICVFISPCFLCLDVQILIKAHPSCLLIRNKAGKTALELAQEHGYQVGFFR